MTELELENLLKQKVESFDLEKRSFDSLEQIFSNNSEDNEFLCGFTRQEIITKFDGFQFQIGKKNTNSLIRAKIGLYVENLNWIDELEMIGYYELETNLKGEVVDDWFVLNKDKLSAEEKIAGHFQKMNEKLPIEYLKRNHLQYPFVSYVSLAGTLFMSKTFEGSGRFIIRAYQNMDQVGREHFDENYLTEVSTFFVSIIDYLIGNNLVSEKLKQDLTNKRNSG